jgi:hypothetical protein
MDDEHLNNNKYLEKQIYENNTPTKIYEAKTDLDPSTR